MVDENQSISSKWVVVRSRVAIIRDLLDSSNQPPSSTAAFALGQSTLRCLAYAALDPESNSSPIRVVPNSENAVRLLDDYLQLKLGSDAQEHALRTARKMLDNAAGSKSVGEISYEDAILCAESALAVVSVVARLSGVDVGTVASAS